MDGVLRKDGAVLTDAKNIQLGPQVRGSRFCAFEVEADFALSAPSPGAKFTLVVDGEALKFVFVEVRLEGGTWAVAGYVVP